MTWQAPRTLQGGQLLPLPDDGVAISSHPPGWLGKRWRALLDAANRESRDRVNRGRNYAKRGRLRALEVSPGCASAEVCCTDAFHPSVRIRPFSRQEWSTIVDALTADLDLIASLLEGDLPQALVDRLDEAGIALLPVFDELSFDCDCGDYVMPCTHVATVLHVLTDALDGDPFLLLTLRGRDREHLLATLRSHWGDDAPLAGADDQVEEPPPETDWYTSPTEVPAFACTWTTHAVPGAGLRALGPPPGEESLLQTLLPLYEGAADRVREMLDAVPTRPSPRRRVRALRRPDEAPVDAAVADAPPAAPVDRLEVDAAGEPPDAAVDAPAPPAVPGVGPLADRLVDALAERDGASSAELAAGLDATVSQVRAELVDLLALGMVYREQDAAGVRWFLG